MRKLVAPGRPGWALAVVTAALLSFAPRAGAAPLSLQDCVRLALDNALAVEQAHGVVRGADADVMGARAAFLPQLSASGRYTRPENSVPFLRGETQEIVYFDELWSYSANANLLLFDGWGNVSSYKAARSGQDAAESRYLDTRQGVVYETERRFFEVRKNEALLDVQREAVRLSEEQLKKTTAMKELGAATQADVYKAQVDHSNNRLESLRAERNLQVAQASLATYLGMDPRETLQLSEEPLDLEADVNLEGALDRALEVNPELLASAENARAGESGVTAAKSERWPSLSAWYSAGYSFGTPDEFKDENIDLSYGLSMSFTIFDGLVTKSRIRRAQSDLLTAQRTVESTERDVLFAVRQAWLDLEIAREAISVSEEAVRSSEEDLRLAQERYKIGEGTILDVIDAQVNLTRSRSNLVNATYDRRLAVSALHDAIGDIPVPQSSE
jgi:TolC family type I secretion outer membrane protein